MLRWPPPGISNDRSPFVSCRSYIYPQSHLPLKKHFWLKGDGGKKQAAKTTFNWILNICSRKTFKRWGRRRQKERFVSGYTTEGLSCLSVESVGQIILTSSGANWLSADRIQLVAFMILCERGSFMQRTHARCSHRQRNIFLVLGSKINLSNYHPRTDLHLSSSTYPHIPKLGTNTS